MASVRSRGLNESSIRIVWVPGAFEIPFMALTLAQSKKYAAVVCLGCVLQGETSHNRYISESAATGIMLASLKTGVPITFGILTPNTMDQAMKRSDKGSANKGSEAMEAAIEMAETVGDIRRRKK